MSSERSDLTGGCLCGAVRYTAGAEALGNAACHCGMCRSWSGHVWASVMVPKDALKLTGGLVQRAHADRDVIRPVRAPEERGSACRAEPALGFT